MPIALENKEILQNTKKELVDLAKKLVENDLEYNFRLTQQLRQLRQFLIAISVTIVGIAFPQFFMGNIPNVVTDFLIVSLGLFSVTVIIGLFTLIPTASKEKGEIATVYDFHRARVRKILNEIDEIERIENNTEAGQRYESLIQRYPPLQVSPPRFLSAVWEEYIDALLLGIFFVGFCLLIGSLFIGFFT